MTVDWSTRNKGLLSPLRKAMYDFSADEVRAAMAAVMSSDVDVHMPYPFGDLRGHDTLYERCYAPLLKAIPDLERRDNIIVAGECGSGGHWVGCCGFYSGSFIAPWLDIPPTGHLVHMRFHEFYRFEDDRVVEIQALWDIPEVMMQAGAWPMAPSLGREGLVPGPATNDGLVSGPYDASRSKSSCQIVLDMLDHLQRHPGQGGPEVMELPRFWHPRMNWYGPAGIGTARGISGFRNWHQIPFLNAMPDRGQYADEVEYHFFGDGDYVAVTGWPDMIQTVSDGGWMGIAPSGKRISLCSLDFWRIENGLIRENWVLVDLLDVYSQLGVDVFARLREFNKVRVPGEIPFPTGDV
jgi:predicted ester cyclase